METKDRVNIEDMDKEQLVKTMMEQIKKLDRSIQMLIWVELNKVFLTRKDGDEDTDTPESTKKQPMTVEQPDTEVEPDDDNTEEEPDDDNTEEEIEA